MTPPPPVEPSSVKLSITAKGTFGEHSLRTRFEVDEYRNVILSVIMYFLPSDLNCLLDFAISEPIYSGSEPVSILAAEISSSKEGEIGQVIPSSFTQNISRQASYSVSNTNCVFELGRAIEKARSTPVSPDYSYVVIKLKMNAAVRKMPDVYVFDVSTYISTAIRGELYARFVCSLELLLPNDALVIWGSPDLSRLGPNQLDSYGVIDTFDGPYLRSVWAHVEYQSTPWYYRTPNKEILISVFISTLLGSVANSLLRGLWRRIKSAASLKT